jgi:uncharacterized protein
VDVSELLRRPGATQHVSVSTDLEEIRGELARVPEGSGLQLDLQLDSLADGIHVHGEIAGGVTEECARCLRTIPARIEVPVHEVYLYPADAGDDGETYAIEDETLDLEPMVRDAVILALPLNPLCRPDCKGLCPTCGADRNDVECGHDDAPTNVRWGALERLRDMMED